MPATESYLKYSINHRVFLRSIHPQTRQLNYSIPFSSDSVDGTVGALTLEKPFN